MRRSAARPLLFATLFVLAGCKSPCRELSERFCDCVDQYQRTACLQDVADRERNIEPTDADLAACEAKLDTCTIDPDDRTTCDILQTEPGKEACGLAR
ncbi:hypothetical protein [Melittangium boletus]|uniref:Lipoprotein n=1 Tax=Melittangium boletus DSM 14713 TaxID=1294270 RepID=A0A250IJ77_9BACT|nr:hypothetical protein [Melittangium boletus]ATB31006.1 hypothetical protein MEBOL_004468 [Melittangium boletus DSM 14713]